MSDFPSLVGALGHQTSGQDENGLRHEDLHGPADNYSPYSEGLPTIMSKIPPDPELSHMAQVLPSFLISGQLADMSSLASAPAAGDTLSATPTGYSWYSHAEREPSLSSPPVVLQSPVALEPSLFWLTTTATYCTTVLPQVHGHQSAEFEAACHLSLCSYTSTSISTACNFAPQPPLYRVSPPVSQPASWFGAHGVPGAVMASTGGVNSGALPPQRDSWPLPFEAGNLRPFPYAGSHFKLDDVYTSVSAGHCSGSSSE